MNEGANDGDHSCQDSDSWISSLMSAFETMPFHEQKEVVDAILTGGSLRLLSYVQEKLILVSYRDFLTLLPEELKDYLLAFLDASSLLQCCQVSHSWNRIVNSNGRLWYMACRELGIELDVPEISKPASYWKMLFLKSAKLFYDLLHRNAFDSVSYTGHEARITAVAYWNGKVATGSDDKTLRIWDSSNGDYKIKLNTDCSISCIKFDESIIVISSYMGTLKSYSFVSGETLQVFSSHLGAVFSMDFNKELDLLISGGADGKIKLWSLAQGRQDKTLQGHLHWVVHVSLVQCKNASNQYFLLSMDKNEIRVWSLPETRSYDDIQCNQHIAVGIESFNFFTPGLHSDGQFIFFVKQDPRAGGYVLFCCWDILEKKLVREQEMHMPVKMLLAVGQKYACIITPWADSEKPNFLVLRVKDLQIVAKWHCPPSSPTTPCNSQMCIGSRDWLDGLDGRNHLGVVMVAGTHNSLMYILRWKNYPCIQEL